MARQQRALIIGGGPAGSTAALALQHVGLEPVVFEAYPRSSVDVGSYLGVATNGLAALRAVDAHHLVRAVGFPTRRNVLWNHNRRHLATVPFGGTLPDGTTSLTLKRARLSRALEDEAIRRGVRVEFGKRLDSAIEASDGRVIARFTDGTQADGDVLIGADGIHSVTRRLIDPSAPKPRHVGLTNFGGYTPDARLSFEPDAWHMIFGRRAFFGFTLDLGGGAVWFANVPRPQISAAERAATTHDDWQRQLTAVFADDRGPAVDLIHRGRLELAGDSTFDLPHVPRWHRGRLIIVGDAAHAPSPTSGQGASIAMEDGVVLAQCLRDLPSIPEAFVAYERLRRARVERIVAVGARGSSAKVPGPVGRLFRDLMVPIFLRLFAN
ncbi:MAG TPA: FAD-dependent monooxygenase, partial [Chloroflexota bacterium]|nr:FAD-dependent monooxygenase [Chloroflexota bacterium]